MDVKALGSFTEDLKLAKKHGKSLSKLHSVIDRLQQHIPLDRRFRVHRLTGNWADHWELF